MGKKSIYGAHFQLLMYVLQRSQANLTQGVEEINCGKVGSPFVFCLDNKNYQSRILIDLLAFCTKFGLN